MFPAGLKGTCSAGSRDARGLATFEYVLLLVLIAIGSVAAWKTFGGDVGDLGDASAGCVRRLESGECAGGSDVVGGAVHAPSTPALGSSGRPRSAANALADSSGTSLVPPPQPASRESRSEDDVPTDRIRFSRSAPVVLGSSWTAPGFSSKRLVGLYTDALDDLKDTGFGEVVSSVREEAYSDEPLVDTRGASGVEAVSLGAYDAAVELGRMAARTGFDTHDLVVEALSDPEAVGKAITDGAAHLVRNPSAVWQAASRAVKGASSAIGNRISETYEACSNGDAAACSSRVFQTAGLAAVGVKGALEVGAAAMNAGRGLGAIWKRARAVHHVPDVDVPTPLRSETPRASAGEGTMIPHSGVPHGHTPVAMEAGAPPGPRRTIVVEDPQIGPVVRAGLSPDLDHWANTYPPLRRELLEAHAEGWTIRYGEPGGGTYASRRDKAIVIDPSSSPSAQASELVHEIGHSRTPIPTLDFDDRASFIRENVRLRMEDEGLQVLRQLDFERWAQANHPERLTHSRVATMRRGPEIENVYRELQAGRITRDQARDQIGWQVFQMTGGDSQRTYWDLWNDHYATRFNDLHPSR